MRAGRAARRCEPGPPGGAAASHAGQREEGDKGSDWRRNDDASATETCVGCRAHLPWFTKCHVDRKERKLEEGKH